MAFGIAGIAQKGAVLFYGNGYGPVGTAMMIESIIILFLGWSNTLGTQYLVPTNRVHKYTQSVMIGAGINIILNIPLINFFGLDGAMFATVISQFIIILYQFNLVKNELNFHMMFRDNHKYLFSGLLMFIVVYYMNNKMSGNFISLVIQIIIGAIIYIIMMFLLRGHLLKVIFNKKSVN